MRTTLQRYVHQQSYHSQFVASDDHHAYHATALNTGPAWIEDQVQRNLEETDELAVDRTTPPTEALNNVVLLQSVARADLWNVDDDNVAVDEPPPTPLQLVGQAMDAVRRQNDRVRQKDKADHDQRRRDRVTRALDNGLRPILQYDDSLTFVRRDLPEKKVL